jgi:acetylglutamate synthase
LNKVRNSANRSLGTVNSGREVPSHRKASLAKRLATPVARDEGSTQRVHNLHSFLDFDDVPWNNNNAEHAVKAFALLRRVMDGLTTEKGLRDTLVLLSVCETCKCRNVDFLDFLRSGSKDIDDFVIRGSNQRLQRAD